MRTRKTFTLDGAAHQILERVGNYSDYVNKLIVLHANDWTEALAHVRERGWQSAEILAVCDALAGYNLAHASRGASFLADELARLEESQGDFSKRQVSSQRRQRCFAQIAQDQTLAASLATLAREFWLFNEDCQNAIRAEPRKR